MIERLKANLSGFFVGKDEVIENVLVCFLAEGHVLLEDVPGVGKTTLARCIAKTVDCDFGRIQFTPDTLPGDVTGMSIYNTKTGEFEYRQGAVMHQVVLADEINRTSPKTQASLLEAMAEKQVTVDGQIFALPQPFMVLATQNPVEYLGTYPLPEAQVDRFMMRLSIGYPGEEAQMQLARNFLEGKTVEQMTSVCKAQELCELQMKVKQVTVTDGVLKYIQDMIEATRQEKSFVLGASPRAMLHLIRASQAKAYMQGRDYVKPDDVKAVAVNVLHHRMTLTSEAKIRKENVDRLLETIVLHVKVPMK